VSALSDLVAWSMGRLRMKGTAWIVALTLISVSLIGSRAHAQSEAVWHACPFAFDKATSMLVMRLKAKIRPDELAGMGDLVCTSVKLYMDYNKSRPKAAPVPPPTAQQIFCANSQSLEYCGKTPLAPPTFKQALRGGAKENFVGGWAAKCMQANPTAQGCAAAILQQAIADAETR
jgi:hypothetical protein